MISLMRAHQITFEIAVLPEPLACRQLTWTRYMTHRRMKLALAGILKGEGFVGKIPHLSLHSVADLALRADDRELGA